MGTLRRAVPSDPTQRAMALLWTAFTAAYIGFFYVFQDAEEIAEAGLDGYLEVVLLGLPTVVLLGGMLWLRESGISPDLHPRMVGWTVGMALVFLVAMATGLYVIESRFDPGERWLILLLSVGFGASAGTVMGALEMRSKANERARNRSVAVARRKERERSQLEHLNHYLRHEVLNETNKIIGYADLLATRIEGEGTDAEYLDAIHRSGEEIAAFVQSVRGILDDTDHEPDLDRVDLMSVLETEAEQLGRLRPGVDVDVSGPDSVTVLSGDLLGRAFRNLLENAIEHGDGQPTVTITVEERGDEVAVHVHDDGPGIPTEERAGLFDPPKAGDHGYGLFFTRNVIWMYGGELELGETGADGTRFVVHLPAETGPTPERSAAAPGAAE